MALTTEIDDAAVKRAFSLLSQRVSPSGQRSVLASFGRYGKSSTQLRFRSQTGPDGVRWPPSKRVQKRGGQTLRDTGLLRNSINWVVDGKGVAWGTNITYAAAHQFGVDRTVQVPRHQRRIRIVFGRKLKQPKTISVSAHARRMRLPPRPFLGVDDADRAALLAIAERHLAT